MITRLVLCFLILCFGAEYCNSQEALDNLVSRMRRNGPVPAQMVGQSWSEFEKEGSWEGFQSGNQYFIENQICSPNTMVLSKNHEFLILGRFINGRPCYVLISTESGVILDVIQMSIQKQVFQIPIYLSCSGDKLVSGFSDFVSILDLTDKRQAVHKIDKRDPYPVPSKGAVKRTYLDRFVADQDYLYYSEEVETLGEDQGSNTPTVNKLMQLNLVDYTLKTIVSQERPPYRYYVCKFMHDGKLYYIDYQKGADLQFSSYDPNTDEIHATDFARRILKDNFLERGIPKVCRFNGTLTLSYHDKAYVFSDKTLELIASIPNNKRFWGTTYFTGRGYMINDDIFVSLKAGKGFLINDGNRVLPPQYSFTTKINYRHEVVFFDVHTKKPILVKKDIGNSFSDLLSVKTEQGYRFYVNNDTLQVFEVLDSVLR